jgi:hypothetical protein
MKIIINLGREILLLGSVRESIMTPSETSSEKNIFHKLLHAFLLSKYFLTKKTLSNTNIIVSTVFTPDLNPTETIWYHI